MSDKNDDRSLIPSKSDPGFIKNLSRQVRLVLRLIADRRVNPLVKLLPIGSLVYLISPDFFPFIIDDAMVIGLGTYMFMELCPPEVVEEHRRALWGGESEDEKDETVEASFKEK